MLCNVITGFPFGALLAHQLLHIPVLCHAGMLMHLAIENYSTCTADNLAADLLLEIRFDLLSCRALSSQASASVIIVKL